MITGELKSKVDRVWDAFWSGGISNPLEVIEQITYLLFVRRLDDLETLEERKARLGAAGELRFGSDQQEVRWSRFKNEEPAVMFATVGEMVFPFLRTLGGDGSTYGEHMKDARFTIPTPQLLSRVVDLLDEIPMNDRDTNGDLYEYLLSKIASAGVNGQFRTPRHIIKLMVDMTAPAPTDEICDPAAGTAGFLVAASEHIRDVHPSVLTDAAQRKHFHASMFHGYDFDNTMLRIASMNMLMHGIESPDIRYRDSLSEGASEDAEKYTLILANPPFAGSLDYESTSKDLQRVVKTKKTELLFVALFLKLLKPGGRAAVIVPDGVLFGSSRAHKEIRRTLVEDQKLDGIVKLPSGAFRPYAGVSTAILLFTKTNSGGTDHVWFYDVAADGFSLDDKRNAVEATDLPDVLARWRERAETELSRTRTEQSFVVPKHEIVTNGYDLSLNRYKRIVFDHVEQRQPREIVDSLEELEVEFATRLSELKLMFSHDPLYGKKRGRTITVLGELADVTSGITKGRRTGEPTKAVPYLAVANVQAGYLLMEQVKEIEATQSEIAKYALLPGDLVLTEGGDPDKLGRGTVWRQELPLCLHQNHIFRVRVRDGGLDPDYLSAYLASRPAREYFLRSAKQTTGIASINMTQLRNTPVYVATKDEQEEYLRHVRSIAELRRAAESKTAMLRELVSSLGSLAFPSQP